MRNSISFTFYVNESSHHIGGLLNALVNHPRVSAITLITDGPVRAERIELGWDVAFTGNYRTLEGASDEAIALHVENSPPGEFHIFLGMRHVRCVVVGIAACIRLQRRFGLMHEPRVREGWRGVLRFMQSWFTEGRLRKHSQFVLAIGAHGPSWFLKTGYGRAKVFPFAYFISGDGYRKSALAERNDNLVRVGYLGRLEKSKGLPDLIKAMPNLGSNYSLSIAGSGSMKQLIMELSTNNQEITFHGVIPTHDVPKYLENIDIIVQPSLTTDDGWGVVVSEALLSGAAVVTSNKVGASACLMQPWLGRVVPARRPKKIAQALHALTQDGAVTAEVRIARAAWANHRLTGEVGAEYLLSIVDHVTEGFTRPKPFLD